MIIRSAISRVSLAVLVLGVVVACGDDESAATPPASTEADADVTPPKPDAAADAASPVTTTEEVVTSAEESKPDAAVEAGASTSGAGSSSANVPDATPNDAPDAEAGDGGSGDGGSESVPDGGDTGGACMGTDTGGDYTACYERAAEWCDEAPATDLCLNWSSSRDVALFEGLLDCMTEAFDSGDACDDAQAKVDACKASVDATACVEHLDICTQVYGDCEEYSVEECDQDLARFNIMWIGNGVGSYTCPYYPSYFLGE